MAALFSGSITRISGAGALIEEYFGLPNRLGRCGLLILMAVMILLGLEKIVSIMEVVGPIVIVCTFIVMIVSILNGGMSLSEGTVLAASFVIFAAQTMNISVVGGTQQPNLVLAGTYMPAFSLLFAAVFGIGLACFAVMIVRTLMKYTGHDADQKYLDRIRQMRRGGNGA